MKTSHLVTTLSTAMLAIYGVSAFAAGEAAQVIFTNDKLTVIDAKGIERAVKQGDFIQPGERVVTSQGVMGQIRLPDGTLLGARPGTDIKLESFLGAIDKNVLVLNEGNVRVINLESARGPKPLPVDIVSPNSTMRLSAGDGETIHVKLGDSRNVDPGTYNRLQIGVAALSNPTGNLALSPLQSSFVPKTGVAPTVITAFPINLVRTTLTPLLTTTRLTTTSPLTLPTLSTFSTQLIVPTTTTASTGGTTTLSSNLISSTSLTTNIAKDISLATTSLASPTFTTATNTVVATNTLTTTKTTTTLATLSPTISPTISPTFTAFAPTTTIVKAPTTTYIAPTTTTLRILSTRILTP
jgi:hypothetical protein